MFVYLIISQACIEFWYIFKAILIRETQKVVQLLAPITVWGASWGKITLSMHLSGDA
jgi:hypothetical protein